jgi:signal transduction histidine kinase
MSIRARLFLVVGLPVALVVVGLSVLAWRGARAEVAASLERELKAVATIAATSINPQQARFLVPGEEGSRTYKRVAARLHAIQSATGSIRAVLVDAEERVRADGDSKLAVFSEAPRVALDRVEFRATLDTGQAQVSIPFTDAAGDSYLAVYALVPEPAGASDFGLESGPKVVLALEAPTAALDAADRVATYLIGICIFAILIVAAIALWVASSITSPVLRLSGEAERLGKGRLKTPIWVPPGRDEVALLGRTLEGMRKDLDERDRERQMMLAGIAHEVRNPLGGMELFSGLLEEAIDELPSDEAVDHESRADLRSHTQRVRRELRYLTGVVNDFLAFARDLPPSRERVDVPALLEEICQLKAKADHAKVEVEVAGVERFPLDRGRIKEALLNLVENAQQASPADSVVKLNAWTEGEDLFFSVTDEGKGMSADTVERAFAPFFTTREKGSGLGLPLVRKFARDHSGDATIESTEGAGTTITLRLGPPSELEERSVDDEPALLGDGEPLLGDDEEPALLGDG